MMMNRDRLGFWARFAAVAFALIFIGSFVFLGVGSNTSLNILDLLQNRNQQPQPQSQQNTLDQQVKASEKQLQKRPNDPQKIKTTAALYFQANRLSDARRLLERGRKVAPKDAEMAVLLGQVYGLEAQSASGKDQKSGYKKAAKQYAAAAKLSPKNADYQLLAGQAYQQSGDAGRAIQYYNGYLDRDPKGQYAKEVKQQIKQLLAPEKTGGAPKSGG